MKKELREERAELLKTQNMMRADLDRFRTLDWVKERGLLQNKYELLAQEMDRLRVLKFKSRDIARDALKEES